MITQEHGRSFISNTDTQIGRFYYMDDYIQAILSWIMYFDITSDAEIFISRTKYVLLSSWKVRRPCESVKNSYLNFSGTAQQFFLPSSAENFGFRTASNFSCAEQAVSSFRCVLVQIK